MRSEIQVKKLCIRDLLSHFRDARFHATSSGEMQPNRGSDSANDP
jgi:hypothetical protein